jgi:hypothetical protein
VIKNKNITKRHDKLEKKKKKEKSMVTIHRVIEFWETFVSFPLYFRNSKYTTLFSIRKYGYGCFLKYLLY